MIGGIIQNHRIEQASLFVLVNMAEKMIFQIIEVDFYSGYKRGEKPKAFTLHNHRYQIDAIIDRWYEGSMDAQRPILNYFKVQAEGKLFLLRYNPKFDTWAIKID